MIQPVTTSSLNEAVANGHSQSIGRLSRNISSPWLRVLLSGVVLGVVTAGVLLATSELTFRSTALVRISVAPPYLLYPTSTAGGDRFAETQIELLRSAYLTRRAIETHGLLQFPEVGAQGGDIDEGPRLIPRVSVTRIGNSDLFEIAFAARDADRARRFLNAVIETYMTRHQSGSDRLRQELVELLGAERAKIRLQLTRAAESLRLIQGRSDEHASTQSDAEGEIEAGQIEIDFCRDALRRIADKLMMLNVESNAPSQVELIERAITPDQPEVPTPVQKAAVGGAIAFLTPFALYLPVALYAVRAIHS